MSGLVLGQAPVRVPRFRWDQGQGRGSAVSNVELEQSNPELFQKDQFLSLRATQAVDDDRRDARGLFCDDHFRERSWTGQQNVRAGRSQLELLHALGILCSTLVASGLSMTLHPSESPTNLLTV